MTLNRAAATSELRTVHTKSFPMAAASVLALAAIVIGASAAGASPWPGGWGHNHHHHHDHDPTTTTTVQPTTTTVGPTTTTTGGGPTTTTTQPPPPPGGSILFNAPDQLGVDQPITLTSALATARSTSFITANPGRAMAYGPYLAAMRAANPGLHLILYINGAMAQRTQGSSFPDSWYAHNAAGQKITNPVWGNYEMDITAGSPWIANRVSTAQALLAADHFDGVFLDVLGLGGFIGNPVHPGTSTPWTSTEWLAADHGVAMAVKAGLAPGAWVMANGLGNGSRFYGSPPSSGILAGITGADAEGFLGGDWLSNIHMLGTAGAVIQTNNKFNASDRWHRFTLASFALGTNGVDSYFYLAASNSDPDVPDSYQPAAAALGTFTGSVTALPGGAYSRSFTNGMAVANPTNAAVSVTFPGPMTNLDGSMVTSEVLAPQSGDLLHS
jgi:hypothetical protein